MYGLAGIRSELSVQYSTRNPFSPLKRNSIVTRAVLGAALGLLLGDALIETASGDGPFSKGVAILLLVAPLVLPIVTVDGHSDRLDVPELRVSGGTIPLVYEPIRAPPTNSMNSMNSSRSLAGIHRISLTAIESLNLEPLLSLQFLRSQPRQQVCSNGLNVASNYSALSDSRHEGMAFEQVS